MQDVLEGVHDGGERAKVQDEGHDDGVEQALGVQDVGQLRRERSARARRLPLACGLTLAYPTVKPIAMGRLTHVFRKGMISAPEPGAVTTSTSCEKRSKRPPIKISIAPSRASIAHLGVAEDGVVEQDAEEHQAQGNDLLPREGRVAEEGGLGFALASRGLGGRQDRLLLLDLGRHERAGRLGSADERGLKKMLNFTESDIVGSLSDWRTLIGEVNAVLTMRAGINGLTTTGRETPADRIAVLLDSIVTLIRLARVRVNFVHPFPVRGVCDSFALSRSSRSPLCRNANTLSLFYLDPPLKSCKLHAQTPRAL